MEIPLNLHEVLQFPIASPIDAHLTDEASLGICEPTKAPKEKDR